MHGKIQLVRYVVTSLIEKKIGFSKLIEHR